LKKSEDASTFHTFGFLWGVLFFFFFFCQSFGFIFLGDFFFFFCVFFLCLGLLVYV